MIKKLFSILYLLTVLFFSCQSTSNKSLQEFKKIDLSLQAGSNETVQTQSYTGAYLAVTSGKENNKELASHADKLFHTMESAKFYIDSLKQSLREADPSGMKTSVASQVFINTNASQKLKAKLLDSYSMLTIDESKKEELKNSLSLIKEICTTDTWNKKYVDNIPTAGIITVLSKIENDLNNAAAIVLIDMKEKLK